MLQPLSPVIVIPKMLVTNTTQPEQLTALFKQHAQKCLLIYKLCVIFCMYNINMDQRPYLLFTTFFDVFLLLILSQSQNVTWLSVKELEDLKYFFVSPKVK
jgi:hypothetical protein